MLTDVALPIGAIAPLEQASLDETREVTTHRGAGHTIQALTDRLVRGEDDHLGVPAKRIVRKEAEEPLQNRQITFRDPKGRLRLGELAQEFPLVNGSGRNRCLGSLNDAQMGVRNRPHKRRDWCVLHENVHEDKNSRARESLCACGVGARTLHSEVRKLRFCSGLIPVRNLTKVS